MENPIVTEEDLITILRHYDNNSYDATVACEPGSLDDTVIKKCEQLFKHDYSLMELDNSAGILSTRYPARIFIPESEHGHMAATITASTVNMLSSSTSSSSNGSSTSVTSGSESENNVNGNANGNGNANANGNTNGNGNGNGNGTVTFNSMPPQQQQQQRTIYEDLCDLVHMRDIVTTAKYARCRQRFVAPVILYRGKYICRSATISVPQETYGRKMVEYACGFFSNTQSQTTAPAAVVETNENTESTEESLTTPVESAGFTYSEVLRSDIQLLQALNVKTIIDLMVEKRKVKYFMTVSSSEKAERDNLYCDFDLLSLPYPGCEFFQLFRDHNYHAEGLLYDWDKSFNDAEISLPTVGPAAELDIDWQDYRNWDAVQLTQNYLKATLKYIHDSNAGLLVHCISGWDRTPLFISMLRLSLWADGLIHQSLNALQIIYLSVAYDWYLFGHQLSDRVKRGEEIMLFAFHVLKYLKSDEYSIVEHRKRAKTPSNGSSVSVTRQDDESPIREDLLLSLDEGSNESFTNICDTPMTESLQAPTTPVTNSRSPNSKRVRTSPISVPGTNTNASTSPISVPGTNANTSTSPISVPGTNANTSTSPISVPATNTGEPRQRQESTSSEHSWHMVTETGSIDSTAGNYMRNYCSERAATEPANSDIPANGSVTSNSSNSSNGSSGSLGSSISTLSAPSSSSSSNGSPSTFTMLNGDGANTREEATPSTSAQNHKPPPTTRQQRLNAVRAIFFKSYSKTVGLKFRNGSNGLF